MWPVDNVAGQCRRKRHPLANFGDDARYLACSATQLLAERLKALSAPAGDENLLPAHLDRSKSRPNRGTGFRYMLARSIRDIELAC